MKYQKQTVANFQEIIERFDFESVHALMLINRWKYAGEDETPSIEALTSMVKSMMWALAENPRANCRVSSGGFVLTRFEWDHCFDYQLVFAWANTSQTESKEV